MLSSRYHKRLPELMSRCMCFALGGVPGPFLTIERNQTIQSTTCITLIMISSDHCQQQLYCTLHLPNVLLLSSRACMICVAYLHPHQSHARIPGCYTPAGLTEHAVYTESTCAFRVAASDGSYTSVWGTGCTAVHTLMTITWCCITLVHQRYTFSTGRDKAPSYHAWPRTGAAHEHTHASAHAHVHLHTWGHLHTPSTPPCGSNCGKILPMHGSAVSCRVERTRREPARPNPMPSRGHQHTSCNCPGGQ